MRLTILNVLLGFLAAANCHVIIPQLMDYINLHKWTDKTGTTELLATHTAQLESNAGEHGASTHTSKDPDTTIFNKSWEELVHLEFIPKGSLVPSVLKTCIEYLTKHLTDHSNTGADVNLFNPTAQAALTPDVINAAFNVINRTKNLHLKEKQTNTHDMLLACRVIMDILGDLEYSLLPYDIVIDAVDGQEIDMNFLMSNINKRMTHDSSFELFQMVFGLLQQTAEISLNSETVAQRAEYLTYQMWNSLIFNRLDGTIVHITPDERIVKVISTLIEKFREYLEDIARDRLACNYLLPESDFVKQNWSDYNPVVNGLSNTNGIPKIIEFCAAHILKVLTASDRKMFFNLTPRADTCKAINIINTRRTLDGLFRYFHGDPEGTVAASIILHLVKYANGFFSAHIDKKGYRFTKEILNTETAKMSEQQFKIFQFICELLLRVLEHNPKRVRSAKTLGASIEDYVVHVTADRQFGLTGKVQEEVRESIRTVLGNFFTYLNLKELARMGPANSRTPGK